MKKKNYNYKILKVMKSTSKTIISHYLLSITFYDKFLQLKSYVGLIIFHWILPNIIHSQTECGEYFVEYCQSHRTLLWI